MKDLTRTALCSKWVFFTLLFVLTTKANAQLHEWSKQPAVEFYYSPLKQNRYSRSSGINPDETYLENTTNLALSFPLNQRLRLGTQFLHITSRVTDEPVDRAYMGGIFAQYNFIAKQRLGIYLESGYSFGNICPCGDAETYSVDSLTHFISLGAGFSYNLTKRLHLKAGFINYMPIVGSSDIHNWTQPFIGVKYHFGKSFKVPFQSVFRERKRTPAVHEAGRFWVAPEQQKWTVGFSTAGIIINQVRPLSGQTTPLLKYREYSITPRVNYWFNQAIMAGVQGTYYHYENNQNTIPDINGMGVGAQVRIYPLSFKNPKEFRAIRLRAKSIWHISPIVGAEFRAANYSWLAPERTGQAWQYFDIQPYAGVVLSHKDWFNLFWSIGPNFGIGDYQNINRSSTIRVIGLEYNFGR